MRVLRTWSSWLAGVLLVLGACSSDSTGGSGTTDVTVFLTDAPGDLLEAVVTIDQIYLQGEGGRVVLSDDPETVNLVSLNNTMLIVVDGVEVPAGSYGELRFVISGAYIKVEGATAGSTAIYASDPNYSGLPAGATVAGSLQMPSFGTSGLKVNFEGDVEITGDETSLVVDFDVSQSFGHPAGNSGMWVMHPVVTGATLSEAGSVQVTLTLGSGVALPTIGGTTVTLGSFKASLDGELVSLTSSGSGAFQATFTNVIPGDYSLSIVGPAGLTFTVTPAGPQTVNVSPGAQATATFTITAASAP